MFASVIFEMSALPSLINHLPLDKLHFFFLKKNQPKDSACDLHYSTQENSLSGFANITHNIFGNFILPSLSDSIRFLRTPVMINLSKQNNVLILSISFVWCFIWYIYWYSKLVTFTFHIFFLIQLKRTRSLKILLFIK